MAIRTPLMTHQKTIVDAAAPAPFFGIFAGYGVGKSLCALSIIERNAWEIVLIVSTKTSVSSTWPEQISQHSNFFYVPLVGSSKEKFKAIQQASIRFAGYPRSQKKTLVFLINFDGVKNIYSILAAIKPQAVFLDESMRIKTPAAIRSKVMWALGKFIKRRYLMTGFPVTENLTEVYSQIKFLDQGAAFGTSYKLFLKTYFDKKGGKYIPKKGAARKIFNKIKDFCIMIPDTVIKLPPAVENKIALHPSAMQEKYLAQLKDDFKVELGRVQVRIESIYALLAKSIQVCNGFLRDSNGNIVIIDTPKDQALFELLEKIGKQKVLIWVTDIQTLKKIYRLLVRFGYGTLALYGDTKDPGAVVRTFQHSKRYNALVATIQKANESITLTNCRHAIYYSRPWSNDQFGNSKARIRRKGSEKYDSINYYYIYLAGTVEELIQWNLKTKEDLVKKLKMHFS